MSTKYKLDLSQTSRSLTILPAVWLAAVASVMVVILSYSNTPGHATMAPNTWPAGSRISRAAGEPSLILFAHPRCPCTRATIGELELLMARSQGKLKAQVWFIHPAETAGDWTKTDLWRTAAAIPGVTVHEDDDQAEARRFHAETSGETLLYDGDGKLMFQGGITISRGHSGDNPGRDAVAALLELATAKQVQNPVFGCPLSATKCQPESAWKPQPPPTP
jgi:hypothetical protein